MLGSGALWPGTRGQPQASPNPDAALPAEGHPAGTSGLASPLNRKPGCEAVSPLTCQRERTLLASCMRDLRPSPLELTWASPQRPELAWAPAGRGRVIGGRW